MAYQALYRKFRPKVFDDVLGQEHITTTLKNQILNNNVAHAYLFSGIRGTGKTSTAKIFSRAINCVNNKDGNPCNECEICKGILSDTVMDVVEIDAASNNSVEDIRELRENSKYPPSKSKLKVYIVDEVHMLSKGAFNALLKTLEEPPKHLVFILATTEPQKLPATILSRCQRFDFKRITSYDIVENMKKICEDLDITIEDRALNLIARNSDGAMRDALSILDQCISFSSKEVSYDYVLSVLGAVNNELIFELTNNIIEKNIDNILDNIHNIVQSGKDINQFIKDLILHFRNLMIVKSSSNTESTINENMDIVEELKAQSDKINLGTIISYLNILSEAETQSKWSSQPRIILEVSIMKMINVIPEATVEDLLKRIDDLESKIKNGNFINNVSVNTSKTNNIDVGIKERQPGKSYNEKEELIEKTEKVSQNDIKQDNNELEEDVRIPNTDISFDYVSKEWSNILKKVKTEKIGLHALIMEGKPANLKNGVLTIAFDEGFGFHKDAVDKKENKESIEKIISDYLNSKIELKLIMASEIVNVQQEKIKSEDNSKELIEEVIDIFGEEVVEVED
ncbi:DNA polymerase III subunit delta' [Gottschalkia purinilytica]|uniref:DNA-directed DNA polymerase n=1 Tax=Gottschalkia purinilytica TaxID=1503 RepID=A0A0L0W7M0_GOTPU|nr:DNA polymerase III subunit gamma/tau [Gottschalkia purinilytica]KNF07519.1 DNA polymerase III subunit delta' [Gottschalkia purinilytica]